MEYEFYEYMGFDKESNRQAREFYAKFFVSCQNILELACGRGELMSVLVEQGKKVLGVDIDQKMVRHAREEDLNVIEADAFEFLKENETKFDGIFSAHFIEHLNTDQVNDLISLCHANLIDGGILVIAAPNPGCITTTLHEFWWDPTHVRMYDLPLLEFLMSRAGFEIIESGLNPKNWSGPPIDINSLDLKSVASLDLQDRPEISTSTSPDPSGKESFSRRLLKRILKILFPAQLEELRLIRNRLESIDQSLESVSQNLRIISQNVETVNEGANVISSDLKAIISQLYPPNELYVAVRRK